LLVDQHCLVRVVALSNNHGLSALLNLGQTIENESQTSPQHTPYISCLEKGPNPHSKFNICSLAS
jgi:hypothetical protein